MFYHLLTLLRSSLYKTLQWLAYRLAIVKAHTDLPLIFYLRPTYYQLEFRYDTNWRGVLPFRFKFNKVNHSLNRDIFMLSNKDDIAYGAMQVQARSVAY